MAPAGDNGGGGNAVNYPAAYPGVIAVGATARDGELAPFTNTGSYVALTAPGAAGPAVAIDPDATAGPPVGLTVAAPGGGYQTLASTDMAAALTAGVAALIRGRYPWLTAAEVTQAIEDGATAPRSRPGGLDRDEFWHRRRVGPRRAQRRERARPGRRARRRSPATHAASASAPAAQPAVPARRRRTRPRPSSRATPAGRSARSSLDLLVAVCVLIAGLICALAVTWVRRRRRSARADDAARDGRGRGPGRHSRALPPAVPALQRPPDPGWPRTPPRAAIGAGSAWVSANPSVRPSPGRAADGPLPPVGAVAVGVRVGAGPQGAAAVAAVEHRPDVRLEPGRDDRPAPPRRRRRSRTLARTDPGFTPAAQMVASPRAPGHGHRP